MINKYNQTIIQEYIINEINPFLEIKRKKYFMEILNKFYSILSAEIPHIKKDYVDKMIIRFFFQQYVKDSYNREKIDPFFPTTNNEYVQILEDLKHLLKDDQSRIQDLFKKLDVSKLINQAIRQIHEYFNSDTYKNIKNNIKIVVKDKDEVHYSLLFYCKYNDKIKRYKENITIRKKLYDKLKGKYMSYINNKVDRVPIVGLMVGNPVDSHNGPRDNESNNMANNGVNGAILDINMLIWCLIYRYRIFENKTQSLSVGLKIYNQIKFKYSTPIELFSSSINSTFPQFCSLYYDIEKYFGSLGSFFNLEIVEGNYTFNPPFDPYVMELAIIHLLKSFETSTSNITVFGFIPIWDSEGKIEMNRVCQNSKKLDNDYPEYNILEIMKKSKYLKLIKPICKDNMPYYEHIDGKTIFASHTYVFYLSNHLTATTIDPII